MFSHPLLYPAEQLLGHLLLNHPVVALRRDACAATKYHIPRETLRRHYQRYLKAMGINKTPDPPKSGSTTPTSRPPSNSTSSNNNNSKGVLPLPHPMSGMPPTSLPQSFTGLSGFAAAAAAGSGEDGASSNL